MFKKKLFLLFAIALTTLFQLIPTTTSAKVHPVSDSNDIYASIDFWGTSAEEEKGNNYLKENKKFGVELLLADSFTTTSLESVVVGIDGGNGKDVINNNQPISVNIYSDTPFSVITGIGIDSGNGRDTVINRDTVDVDALAVAPDTKGAAIGIDAGNGKDTVTNQGSVDASATSIAGVADETWNFIGSQNTEIRITSQAEAVGINGGSDNSKDELLNTGGLSVLATAKTSVDAVTAVFAGKAGTTISLSANASTVGIDGGNGKDTLINEGEIAVDSLATTESLGVSLTYAGAAKTNEDEGSPALVISTSTGLFGGNGMDEITNIGSIKVTSSAAANAENVALSAKGTASADSSLGARAEARGIDGGLAKDVLINAGTIDVIASASSFGLSADVNLVDVTQTDLTRNAESTVIGIDGGMADDEISNSGTLTATALSTVEAWNLDFNGLDTAIVDSSITANSTSTGMTGGEGRESLFNSGEITSKATSKIQSWTFEFSAADIVSGNASTTANATATGIDASKGDEYVSNRGSVTADAFIELQVGGITLSLVDLSFLQDIGKWMGIEEDKLKLGNAATTLNSTAVGICMDPESPDDARHEEDDVVFNHGDVTAKAVANALSVGVSIGAEGVPAGLLDALAVWDDANLANASTTVTATATGIDAAQGENFIDHDGVITATAEATVNGVNVGLGLPLLEPFMDIPSPAFTLAKEGSSAEAKAFGIKTGDDADYISSAGEVNANADAQAVAVSASLIFQGIIDSVDKWDIAFGRTDVTTSTVATANGITVAAGDDAVTNSANVTADAEALSVGAAVSMAYQNKVEKAIDIEGTLVDTNTSATATAKAVDTGEGNDAIENSGMLTAKADSQDIAVSLSGAIVNEAEKSLVINGAIARTDAYSDSDAKGIEAGTGADTIINTGAMDIDSYAMAVGAGIALTVQGSQKSGAGLSASLASSTTTSETNAVAIDGGTGVSLIDNSGNLDIDATTTSVAASIGITFDKEKSKGAGFSLVNAQNSAISTAMGIATDGMEDIVHNTGNIEAEASTTAVAASVSFVRKGVAAGATIDPASFDSGNTGKSTAKAITTGAGDDEIVSNATLAATAGTVAPSVGIAIAVKGVSAAVTTSDAESEAVGIEAGTGMDTVQSSGEITAEADSTAVAASVAISKEGLTVAGDTVWDGGTTATATTKGIDVGTGDDKISNAANIKTDSSAIAPSIGVSISAKGVNAAISTATSHADSVGIDAGQGDDSIYNTGNIETDSMANADSIAVSITGKGVSGSANDVWDGGVETNATGSGIDAGPGANTVVNEGIINSDADAVTVSAAVAIVGKGIGVSVSTSTAEAETTGINLGDESGTVHNKNEIITDADSTAVTVNVDIAGKGVVVAADEVWNGGTKSLATTSGIRSGAGSDYIKNESRIDSEVDATTVSAGISIVGKGVGLATSTSTATGLTTGIETAAGSDVIDNSGVIETESDAIAVAASVSVAGTGIAGTADAVWDGGTKANASALGINSGTGDDQITNTASITADSSAIAPSIGVSITAKGINAAISTATSHADAVGIDAGQGNDSIYNTGNIETDSMANADSISVSIAGKGIAGAANDVWDGGVEAIATGSGIDAGSGANTVVNEGIINSDADGITVSAAVAIVGSGIGVSASTSTAEAETTGISLGEEAGTVHNKNEIITDADSTAVSVNVAIAGQGIAGSADAVWDGGTKSTATTTGIRSGASADFVKNESKIDSEVDATTVSAGISVVGTGIGLATSTSTATGLTTGIGTGAGSDIIDNSGVIETESDAIAVTASVSVAGTGIAGSADAVWDGGTKADAASLGINAGAGDNIISNTAEIASESDATTVSAAISVAGTGIGLATSTSTARAGAFGINTENGVDTVINTGELDIDAAATAVSAQVSVVGTGIAAASDAVWDGGTQATASARGINTAAESDVISNEAIIDAETDAVTVSAAISVAGTGVGVSMSEATASAESIGIASGTGEDTIANTQMINADASSTAVGVSVSVTGIGVSGAGGSVWDGGTKGYAIAKAIDAGQDNDTVTNSGALTAESSTTSTSVGVAIAAKGLAFTTATSTAVADTTGIDAGKGNDAITNTGAITANAESDAVTVQVSVAGVGLAGAADSVWDNGTSATATARGIYGADGLDGIWNEGDIIADAEADTSSIAVSATLAGVAATTATSLAETEANAIDGGSGNDSIVNKANLTASAESDAITVAVSAVGAGVALAADSVWDNGTTAEAIARGAYGNDGNDNIQSEGNVVADADADTTSVAVTVALAGVAGTIATSTATSEASGFDGGIGNDTITSIGSITSTATAKADTVTVSVAGVGAALAADSVWDGGTTAQATARGFAGGSGNDILLSDGLMTIVADAETDSTAVTVALAGIAGTVVSSTALAESTGMDGGSGVDIIESHKVINSTAIADADTVQVSISGIGASISADSAWDGGTTAIARAKGLDGGADNDSLLSKEGINVASTAISDSTAVAVTLAGIASTTAVSSATSIATGIDGGTDSDVMESDGTITATASAEADALSVSVAGLGVAAGDNPFWDHTTTSTAIAGGLTGGTGNDSIVNRKSILASVKSDAEATEVSVALLGVTFGDTATAAYAYGTGIDGGQGEDVILNEGAIIVGGLPDTVIPMARAEVDSVGVSLVGAAIGDASTTAGASSRGIDGGSGNDIINNKKAINVAATSASDISATTVGIIGYAGQEANAISVADASGITGGSGNDSMLSTGALNAYSASTVTLDSAAFTFAGATDAKGSTTAVTRATGFAGEAGEDYIRSENTITADAISTLTTEGNTTAVFGSAGSEMTSGAVTSSTGIDGGADNDIIENTAMIDVSSTANLSTSTSGFTLGGASSDKSTMAAITASGGISGGFGNDSILSTNIIDVEATSLMTSSNSSTTIFGSASALASSGAVTSAAGIYGGDGIDIIESRALIDVSSLAILTMSGSSFSLFGTASAEGALAAWTESSGIVGGDGADSIRSEVGINVSAISALNSSSNSDAIFGSAKAKGTSGAITKATGINGGEGNDILQTLGTINATSLATLTLSSSAFTFGGVTAVNGALAASTESRGIVGGEGEDYVLSEGAINLTAISILTAQAKSETVFGTSTAGGTTIARTNAYGIETGSENDIIESTTNIDITTSTTASTNRSTYVFGGGSATDAVMQANAESAGISAGSGDDWVSNGGNISVNTTSSISSTGYAYAEFGGSEAHGLTVSNSTVQGIDAGAGDDTIFNDGDISLKGLVDSMADHQTETGWLFGDGDSASEVKSVIKGGGISLGNGGNTLVNSGNVSARLGASADTYSYSDGADIIDGNAKSISKSTAFADMAGVYAGNGGTFIINEGEINIVTQNETYNDNLELLISPVIAKAIADTDGDGIAGDGSAYATAVATSTAAGIMVGDGANTILNSNTGQIKGVAIISGYAKTTADADEQGTDRTNSTVDLTANAFGIKTGDGDSIVINDGSIASTATPIILKASAVSDGDFAVGNVDAKSTATVDITATANGIALGDGNSNVFISKDASVVVTSMVLTQDDSFLSKADGDGINGDGDAWGYVTFSSDAKAIGAGDGNHIISNDGMIHVSATLDFDGTVVSDGDEDAHAKSTFEVTSDASAIGIQTGEGTDLITNTGSIDAEATPSLDLAYANSDGGSPYQPVDSTSHSTVDMDATATGILTGDGNKEIFNTGYINVIADPFAEAKSRADGDSGTGVNSGDGWAYATTTVSATAHGILTGAGQNVIINEGLIHIEATATANAVTTADGDDYGDATADSKAHAYAYAYGVRTSGGNDTLTNTGTIIASADANPTATASADGGWAGDSYPSILAEGEALAVAVHLGNGDNALASNGIINSTATARSTSVFAQNIIATSTAVASGVGDDELIFGEDSVVSSLAKAETPLFSGSTDAYSLGVNAGTGNNIVANYGLINAEARSKIGFLGIQDIAAIGIKTGSGNDNIYNAGSITTLRATYNLLGGWTTNPGIAIDSGAGDDIVALAENSITNGSIQLGGGDDLILFEGTSSVSETISGDYGRDGIVFSGAGNVNVGFTGFEGDLIKMGPGTFRSENIPQGMNHIIVHEGTMEVGHDYSFSPGGTYTTPVYHDGTCGVLQVNGTAALAGELDIMAAEGIYLDGTEYGVLTSDMVEGAFDTMNLPGSAVLTFDHLYHVGGLDIIVDVASFTSMADNKTEKAIGKYLDRLTPFASGKLYDVIAELQWLPESGFDQAFASVSPAQYRAASKEYVETTRKSFGTIQDRLDGLRKSVAFAPMIKGMPTMEKLSGFLGAPQKPVGQWNKGFYASFQEDDTGMTRLYLEPGKFSILGFDTAVGNNMVAGFGSDHTEVKTTLGYSDANGSVSGSKHFVYGSYMLDNLYLDAAFFYGTAAQNHNRKLRIGTLEGSAASQHEGESFSSYLEIGKFLSRGTSIFQPFFSLEYIQLKEEGFAESGGGPIALRIKARESNMLVSNLGIKAAKIWTINQWNIIPSISLAWRNDIEPADYSTTVSLAGAPGEHFVIDGKEESSHALGVGASVDIFKYGRFRNTLDVSGEIFNDENRYTVDWKLELKF